MSKMPKIYKNYPSRINLENYENACREITVQFSSIPGVHSIYQYGSISCPGLSDLDIAIVLDDVISSSTHKLVQKQNLPNSVLSIMDYATMMIFPRSKFEQITLWDDIRLTPIHGQAINADTVNCRFLEVARIIDWLPERIIRLEELYRCEVIDVRKTLGTLKSCTYTLQKVTSLIGQEDNRSKVIREFTEFRTDWFNYTESSQIDWLWHFADAIKRELYISLKVFGNWWIRNILPKSDISLSTGVFSFAGKFTYEFQNINPGEESVTVAKDKVINLILPAFYSLHFCHYASTEGVISNQIDRHLLISSKKSGLPSEMREILDRRIELVNFWADWLIDNKFASGIFKFGWFLEDAKQGYYDGLSRQK